MTDLYNGADTKVEKDFEEAIRSQAITAINEILNNTSLAKGDIFVVGCSSSEVLGTNIGKGSSYMTAEIIFKSIYPILNERGIYIAAQCCEHLNRALVIERECAEKYGYEPVSVIPQPKAGGSFATVTYQNMRSPVLVEHIKAHAGMDIGGTLIGMHLKDVAVPMRLSVSRIGQATLNSAYTRPKFIGGCRASY